MTRRAKKKGSIERELEELDVASADPSAADGARRIEAALASKHAHVVARAAGLIKEHRLGGHERALCATWGRLLAAGAAADTGCHGKLAVLEALDYTEHDDAEPFIEATRYTQREARWGKPEDTAGNVRVRGGLALTRLRHADVLLVLGRLLGDREASVREGAVDALAEHGDRDGAALLLLRLGAGEDEAAVLAAVVRALFVLAPDEATRAARSMLRDPGLRELVAHAAASANVDDAVSMLVDELRETVLAAERAVLFRALGVSRRAAAREYLLDRVAAGSASDAGAAIVALGVHAYDSRLAADVRAAAEKNAAVDLTAALAEAFPER